MANQPQFEHQRNLGTDTQTHSRLQIDIPNNPDKLKLPENIQLPHHNNHKNTINGQYDHDHI